MSIESVMLTNHLILCHPLILWLSIFPSIRGLFQWVGSLHQVAKVLEVCFSISPSNEYSGLISFRIDWFDLAVKGTLKHLHMHLNSNQQFFSSQPSLWFKMICKYLLLISCLALCFMDGCLCCAKAFKHNSSHFCFYSLYFRKQIQTIAVMPTQQSVLCWCFPLGVYNIWSSI